MLAAAGEEVYAVRVIPGVVEGQVNRERQEEVGWVAMVLRVGIDSRTGGSECSWAGMQRREEKKAL